MEEVKNKTRWFEDWKKSTLDNWKCIIANVAFLKNKNSNQNIKNSININQKPMIHSLFHLFVGKVESILE